MEFYTEIFLPILKRNVKVKSIKNILYFEILKFLKTNNNDIILDCFEQLLSEILVEKEIINSLTNYEKFLILLEARIISLGDKITTSTDSFEGNISIILSYTRNFLLEKIKNYEIVRYCGDEKCKVKLNLPKQFLLKDIDDIYRCVIEEVIVGDERYILNSLSEEEIEMIITNLPAKFSTDILNYIQYISNIAQEVSIISENERTGMKRVAFGLIDNTLFYFIKNIFSEDLNNYYELMYSMIKKLNLDYNNFMQITPNECKMLINFYNSDMKREEDAQKGVSMPKMPTMPNIPKFG
jgi:hypothetical protein